MTHLTRKKEKFNENMEDIEKSLQKGELTEYAKNKITGTGSDQNTIFYERFKKTYGLDDDDFKKEIIKYLPDLLNHLKNGNLAEKYISEKIKAGLIKEPYRQGLAEKHVGKILNPLGYKKCGGYYYNGKLQKEKPNLAIKSIDFINSKKKICIVHKQNTGEGGGQTSDTFLEVNTLEQFVKNPLYAVVVIFTGTTKTDKIRNKYSQYPNIVFCDETNYEKKLNEMEQI